MKKLSKLTGIATLLGVTAMGLIGGREHYLRHHGGATIFQEDLGLINNYATVIENGKEVKYTVDAKARWEVGPNLCAVYAKKIAEDISGKEYGIGSTWELGIDNISFEFGEMEPEKGDLITAYYPKSHYNKVGRRATHTLTYIGTNKNGEYVVAHQFGHNQEVTTLPELEKKYNIIPQQIITPRNNIIQEKYRR